MRRVRLKKRIKLSPLTYILISLFLLIISLTCIFTYIGKVINPKVEKIASLKAKKIVTYVITESVTLDITDTFDANSLIKTDKNQDGTISSIDFNSIMVNKVLADITSNLRKNLKKLENGEIKDLEISDNTLFNVSSEKLSKGIVYEIPTGMILNNSLLSNLGPKVPIKLELIGNVTTDIVTNIKDYGINNAIIEIGVKVKVNEQVILPYSSKQVEVETIIPIAIKLIQGQVPDYYANGNGKSILIPDNDS